MDYEAHRYNLQAQAVKAHEAWVASLTPAERDQLDRLGLLEKPTDSNASEKPEHHEGLAQSYTPDVASDADSLAAILAEAFDLDQRKAAAIAQWHVEIVQHHALAREANFVGRVVGGLLSAANPKLSAAGLAFAMNFAALNGLGSMREYARKVHLTVACISKYKRAWQRELGLADGAHGKTPEARQAFSEAQRKAHWRKQKA